MYFCHIWSVVPLFFFITFDSTILTLCSITSHVTVLLSHSVVLLFSQIWWYHPHIMHYNILCDCTFVTFGGSLFFFFSRIWWYHHKILQYQHHIWLYFFHILWFPYFFFSHLMVPSSHCAVLTSHVTVFLSHTVVPFFFLTFNGIILILCSTNITCDYTFFTFSIFFFSHLMIPSSHCIVPTSHVTVLLSHSVVPYFFLTFDDTVLILCSTNITCDCTFVTLDRKSVV